MINKKIEIYQMTTLDVLIEIKDFLGGGSDE